MHFHIHQWSFIMLSINPYLSFPGTTEEAFNFYKEIFGNEFLSFQRFSDMPDVENLPEFVRPKIMHVSLPITENAIIMGADAVEGFGPSLVVGNNFSLNISCESEDEAIRIFGLLAEGGNVIMNLEKAFWGALFGMLTDKFGIGWMISYQFED